MVIKKINALGIYGGASLNSVEAALIYTDGLDIKQYYKTQIIPYPEDLCLKIRQIIAKRWWNFDELDSNPQVQELRQQISNFYLDIIHEYTAQEKIDCVGVDGLTIVNNPEHKCSYQLEDGSFLAQYLSVPLVTHFHKADLLSGGQASPLSPSLFNLIAADLPKPLLFIDAEAVCSLIYIGESGEIKAFDCAPGRAMLEDWTYRHAKMLTDYNGKLAAIGKVDTVISGALLQHKILRKIPPKSLDIMCFSDKKEHLEGLSLEDGAATVSAFIAEAVYQAALDFLPVIPSHIYINCSEDKNPSLLRLIRQVFAPRQIKPITAINENLNNIGAIVTAFNSVRRLYNLPITYPTTTGSYEPMSGGEIYEKKY